MGRKTVKWNKLKDPKYGFSSCDKCNNIGIIQWHDCLGHTTRYSYCDCYFGKSVESKHKDRENER